MTNTSFLLKKISELEAELRAYKNLLFKLDQTAWQSLGSSNPVKDEK